MKTDTPKSALPVETGPPPAAKKSRVRSLIGLLVLVAIVALPLMVKNFFVFQLTLAMVYAIAIMGLNLLTGFNGQFSLGHGAFYAIGAYTAAIMMEHLGIPYYWTIPAAGIICFVAGYLFGLPALRLEGIYLALATFALAIALPQILKFSPIEHWTGGVQGIVIIKPDAPFGLPINPDQWLYYFTLIVLLLSFAFAYNLVGSRTGHAIKAIRDNPIAAKAMGVNLSLYKSLTLFVGLVVGGVGWIPGAFFGALFILFVPHLAEGVSKGLAGAVYGIMLILLIFVMPSGAAGLLKLVFDRLAAAGWWKVSPEGRK
jgi:branched-chain amino acid transport system permease protein